MWSEEQLLIGSSLLTVLFITLYFGLAVNQAVWFLKACFWLVLGTLKWDSVISWVSNLTTFRSSYDFTIIPVFRIFKLYITVSAVYSVDPSSFFYVWIPNLTSVLRLVTVFPYVFVVRRHVVVQTINVYQRGITPKLNSAKEEKKSENHRAHFLNLAIKEKYALFPFRMCLTEKKNVMAAILGTYPWPTTVHYCSYNRSFLGLSGWAREKNQQWK